MRVTSKGQVTIPKPIRDQLGIDPETELEFELCAEGVLLRIVAPSQGRDAVSRLRELGRLAWTGPTTDEVMELTRGRD